MTRANPAVRQAAASADVLHLSCHGSVSSKVWDAMAASQLCLAGGLVTANDVLDWKLNADLVFMNVCQGGRFFRPAQIDLSTLTVDICVQPG